MYLCAIALVVICATWAYRVNYATQAALGRVASLRAEIANEQEAVAVLRAEWAYLNRPDRLAALVDLHRDALELAPLTPEQFVAVEMFAYPPLPDDDPSLLVTSGDVE